MNKTSSPVIIIGMHRSGTKLLTEVLGGSSVFPGHIVEQNGESVFFQRTNQKILTMAGVGWNNPYDFDKNFYRNEKKIMNHVRREMNGFHSEKKYWTGNYQDYDHWGWKDPRNTITWKIWAGLFPDARFIHIYRNPVDVAASLMGREKGYDDMGMIRWKYNVLRYYIRFGIIARRAPELHDIHKGIRLWEFYVKRAFSIDKNIIHIKYEDLLEEPVRIVSELMEFLSIKKDMSELNQITGKINPTRKYAFLSDSGLVNVYKEIKDGEFLSALGYNEIC